MPDSKYFFGDSPLIPWVGIVELRDADPLKIGRCKVRIFGHHSGDLALMPTASLPDAYPVEPLTGTLWSTPYEGDTVFGFFLDTDCQNPLIVGKVPTAFQNVITVPEGEGYKDARKDLSTYPPRTLEASGGVAYPPYGTDVGSLPFLARSPEKAPTQISPAARVTKAQGTKYATAKGETWNERPTDTAPVYPFNHVYESEGLHLLEFDDTPGAERVNIRHKLGTGIEFFPDGSVVHKIVKDSYTVVLGDSKIGVSGKCDIHIKGDGTLYVEGDLTQHVNGNYNLSVDGNFSRKIRGDEIVNVNGDLKVKSSGDIIAVADGTHWLKGSTLHENSSSTPDVDDIEDFDLPNLPDDTTSTVEQQKFVDKVGSPLAPKDDKDESETASALTGELVNNDVLPETLECPIVEDETKPFTNGDTRYRMQISKNYQLADFTVRALYPHHIAPQGGLTQAAEICNLSNLARNVVDPLAAKYPGLRINCGFRKTQNGTSQHEKGEAVDLQWPSITNGNLSKYMEIAGWVKSNLPFDQLILEHGNTIWLHVSLKKSGTNRKQVLTMYGGSFTPGLSLFGRT
jgi:hypothetical protein